MRKAYIVLAHECTPCFLSLLRTLVHDGSLVVVHYDRSSAGSGIPAALAALLEQHSQVTLAEPVAVTWGEWSIVQATLNGLLALQATGVALDYVTLLSGACMPVKPLALLDAWLERHRGCEFIECVDPDAERWVQGGYQQERWQYFHFLNWRDTPLLFDYAIMAQHALGVRRRMPAGLQPRMGSQWWTLSWATLQKILRFHREHRLERFFRRTWIPDELYFQTLVHAVVEDRSLIRGDSLMYYDFDISGRPRNFYDDNGAELAGSGRFFARKIAPRAAALQDYLAAVARMSVAAFAQHLAAPCPAGQLPDAPGFPPWTSAADVYQFRDFPLVPRSLERGTPRSLLDCDYFLVIAFRRDRAQSLRDRINENRGLHCHGYLLGDREEAVFAGADEAAAIPSQVRSLAQRDADRVGFLRERLAQGGPRLAGFLLDPCTDTAGRELLHDLIADPRCRILLDDNWREVGAAATGASAGSLLEDMSLPVPQAGGGSLLQCHRDVVRHNTCADRLRYLRWILNLLRASEARYLSVGECDPLQWPAATLLDLTR